MVENVELVVPDGVENAVGFSWAVVFAEEAEELGVEVVLGVEAVLDYEGEDLVELSHGSAELEEDGGGVGVDMRWDMVGSFTCLGKQC